jgi:hypothetical protein
MCLSLVYIVWLFTYIDILQSRGFFEVRNGKESKL